MPFVELDRKFLVLDKEEDIDTDVVTRWGWPFDDRMLAWSELLERDRVVLLAEAASGKSTEFRGRVDLLRATGKAAFFARMEEIAVSGLRSAFEDHNDPDRFDAWMRDAKSPGWFFLDSVDEARLNRLGLDTALKRTRRELGSASDRARIYLSCRGSDWRGREDREQFLKHLPACARQRAAAEIVVTADALLDPIFAPRRTGPDEVARKAETSAPTIVRLMPLSHQQRTLLAHSQEIADVTSFASQIRDQGLEALADRPGDLV